MKKILLVILIIGSFIGCSVKCRTNKMNLYAINAKPGITGSFFLGSGSISGSICYYLLAETTIGIKPIILNEYQINHRTYINYIQYGDPYIVVEYIDNLVRGINGDINKAIFYLNRIYIYIPKGSIKNNYIVN